MSLYPIQCDYYAVMFDHFPFALQKNAQRYEKICTYASAESIFTKKVEKSAISAFFSTLT